MNPQPNAPRQSDATRRKAVRRTALLVAAIAVAVYVAFILSGVIGR